MTPWFFVLECVAIAVLIGACASIASIMLWPALGRVLPSAAWRADAAFVLGTMPAVLSVIGTAAAAAPPISSALGYGVDHCPTHGHHLHLCLVHSSASLAPAGALLSCWLLLRTLSLARRLVATSRDLGALQRLGERSSKSLVICVPGSPRICHAVGFVRGRILLSTSLARALPPHHLACALAHERAHLRRRDPLTSLLLSVAGLVQLPGVSGALARAFRVAAEEACDDFAAREVGDPVRVAEALVAVAELQRAQPGFDEAVHAFGEHALERRIRRLLHGRGRAGRARGLALAMLASGACALLATRHTSALHHLVETALKSPF
ncbi:MAG: M56 family metallopeptidase [Deltaproteobacteria bacterium]|nr:M56 family metallopeptidase [Deltaproteobacteria bacterium]